MTSIYKTAFIEIFIVIILSSCQSSQPVVNKKPNPMIGTFSVAWAISDKMADSLNCEGIQYVLQIKEDTTYVFKSTCFVVPKNLLAMDSGKWNFQDSSTLKLNSNSKSESFVNFRKDYNNVTLVIKKKDKIEDTYELDRDTTFRK